MTSYVQHGPYRVVMTPDEHRPYAVQDTRSETIVGRAHTLREAEELARAWEEVADDD